MTWPIQTQSEQYSAFEDGYRFAKDYHTEDLPEGLIGAMGGPSITAGMLNTRTADAANEVWSPDGGTGPGGGGIGRLPIGLGGGGGAGSRALPGGGAQVPSVTPRTLPAPTAPPAPAAPAPALPPSSFGQGAQGTAFPKGTQYSYREAVDTFGMPPESHAYHTEEQEPFTSGPGRSFNPDYGYEPSGYDERRTEAVQGDDESGYNWGPAPGHDPAAEPGPHPDFHDGTPHPFGTPVYQPSRGSYARRHSSFSGARPRLDRSGPTKEAFGTMPQQQQVPMWPGHGYAPGHRVGLPWRDQVIPGTVTHLDGQLVGVGWDDRQHSSEEPADLRPL